MVFGRRRAKGEPDPLAEVDPARAPRRFAPGVSNVLATRRQYVSLLDSLRPGPVRDRLAQLAPQIDEGVLAVWATVQRADEVERIVATLDPDTVTDAYKRAKRSGADPEVMAAHEARFSSVQRLLNSLDDTDERLTLLEARLGGIVARAAEVALATGTGVDDLDTELSGVLTELSALRTALDELG